jgi:hypothetical protein
MQVSGAEQAQRRVKRCRCRAVCSQLARAGASRKLWTRLCAIKSGIPPAQVDAVSMSRLVKEVHPMHLWQHVCSATPTQLVEDQLERACIRKTEDSSGLCLGVQFSGEEEGERAVVADYPLIRVLRASGRTPKHVGRTLPAILPVATGGSLELTPLVVGYFEVSIGPSGGADRAGSCIAVGVATKQFPLLGRFPGWDSSSYGWHSDDGQAFHNSGHGTPFQRGYGPGDVIGCGVDLLPCLPTDRRGYDASAARLFFTRNGRMAGYAFERLDARRAWYPVIGVDAAWLLRVNFGRDPVRPFAFPLHKFAGRQFHVYASTHPHVLSQLHGCTPQVSPHWEATSTASSTSPSDKSRAPPPHLPMSHLSLDQLLDVAAGRPSRAHTPRSVTKAPPECGAVASLLSLAVMAKMKIRDSLRHPLSPEQAPPRPLPSSASLWENPVVWLQSSSESDSEADPPHTVRLPSIPDALSRVFDQPSASTALAWIAGLSTAKPASSITTSFISEPLSAILSLGAATASDRRESNLTLSSLSEALFKGAADDSDASELEDDVPLPPDWVGSSAADQFVRMSLTSSVASAHPPSPTTAAPKTIRASPASWEHPPSTELPLSPIKRAESPPPARWTRGTERGGR